MNIFPVSKIMFFEKIDKSLKITDNFETHYLNQEEIKELIKFLQTEDRFLYFGEGI